MARLILDSGSIIALARRDARMRAILDRALRRGDFVVVPAVVVAETTRGTARDAPVNRVLSAIGEIVTHDEDGGRLAGRLMGASGLDATVDALVAAAALALAPSILVTGDARDMRRLLDGETGVTIQPLS